MSTFCTNSNDVPEIWKFAKILFLYLVAFILGLDGMHRPMKKSRFPEISNCVVECAKCTVMHMFCSTFREVPEKSKSRQIYFSYLCAVILGRDGMNQSMKKSTFFQKFQISSRSLRNVMTWVRFAAIQMMFQKFENLQTITFVIICIYCGCQSVEKCPKACELGPPNSHSNQSESRTRRAEPSLCSKEFTTQI